MAVCGALCGAAYDAGMLLRRLLHFGAAATGAMDLLFGALLATGMTATALSLRTEAFRLYAFAGVGAGLLAWLGTAGALLRFLLAKAAGLKIFKNRRRNALSGQEMTE